MLHLQQLLLEQATKEQLLNIVQEQAKAIEELKQYSESLEENEKRLLDVIRRENQNELKLKKQYSQSQKRVATLFNYVWQIHQATAKGDAYILENVERILNDESETINKKENREIRVKQ